MYPGINDYLIFFFLFLFEILFRSLDLLSPVFGPRGEGRWEGIAIGGIIHNYIRLTGKYNLGGTVGIYLFY